MKKGMKNLFKGFDFDSSLYDSLDVLAMDERVKRGYCSTWKADRRVISLLSLAEMAGMSTGIVTTTRVTHATPASAFAHSVDRDWESDSEKEETAKDDATSCKDIGKPVMSLLTKGVSAVSFFFFFSEISFTGNDRIISRFESLR